jgi:hypothetical protein
VKLPEVAAAARAQQVARHNKPPIQLLVEMVVLVLHLQLQEQQ